MLSKAKRVFSHSSTKKERQEENDTIEEATNHQKEFSVDRRADQKSKMNTGNED